MADSGFEASSDAAESQRVAPRGEVPYPGLRRFEKEESKFFFGRGEQIKQLAKKLGEHRFAAVVGPSGSGKSSLVRAGLLPRLEIGLLPGAEKQWLITTMRPGHRPLARLAERLVLTGALGDVPVGEAARARRVGLLRADLRRGGPSELIEKLASHQPPGTSLLLLVDQFEEIFRFREEDDPGEADAFVAMLLETVRRADSPQGPAPVYVVITMRSDFFGDCDQFAGLPEAINMGQFLTPRMTRDQRRSAIRGPAARREGEVEKALVNRLLNDAGDDPDQLPIMQHALMRIWFRAVERRHDRDGKIILTLDDYRHVGEWEGALRQHAEEAYGELDEEGQRIAEVLFRRLTERRPDKRDLRKPASVQEIADIAGVPPDEVAEVAQVFQQEGRNFIMASDQRPWNPETVLDISHESLIRLWKRLDDWARKEAAAGAEFRRLAYDAGRGEPLRGRALDDALKWRCDNHPSKAWARRYGEDYPPVESFIHQSKRISDDDKRKKKAAEEDKQRRERELAEERARGQAQQKAARLRNLLLLMLSVMVAVAVVFAIVAVFQKCQAEKERGLAKDAQKQAEKDRGLAEEAQKQAEKAQKRAENAQKQAEKALERAQTSEADTEVELLAASVLHAPMLMQNEEYSRAANALQEARDKVDKIDQAVLSEEAKNRIPSLRERSVLLQWFTEVMGPRPEKELNLHVPVNDAAISPDGKLLAVASTQGEIILLDTRLWDVLNRWPLHEGPIHAVRFRPNARELATGGDDGVIRLWSLPGCGQLRSKEPTKRREFKLADDQAKLKEQHDRAKSEEEQGKVRAWSLAFSPDGAWLAGGLEQNVYVWEANSDDKPPTPLVAAGQPIVDLRFNRQVIDNKPATLLAAATSVTPIVWTVKHAEVQQARYLSLDSNVTCVAFDAASSRLAAAGSDVVRVWHSPAVPDKHAELRGHRNEVVDVTFFGDGFFLASASRDRTLRVWDVPSQRTVRILEGHQTGVKRVIADPRDPARLISIGDNGQTLRWNALEPMRAVAGPKGKRDAPNCAAITPDHKTVALGFPDGSVFTRDLADGAQMWSLHTKRDREVLCLAVNPANPAQIASYNPGSIRIAGEAEPAVLPIESPLNSLAFDDTGRYLALASNAGPIGLRDKKTGELAFSDEKGALQANSVAFVRNGQQILSTHYGAVRLWSTSPWPPAAPADELPLEEDFSCADLHSGDADKLAAGGNSGIVWLFSKAKGSDGWQRSKLVTLENSVVALTFNRRGDLLAAADRQSIRIWHLKDQTELVRLPLAAEGQELLAFSFEWEPHTGPRVVAALANGKVLVY